MEYFDLISPSSFSSSAAVFFLLMLVKKEKCIEIMAKIVINNGVKYQIVQTFAIIQLFSTYN